MTIDWWTLALQAVNVADPDLAAGALLLAPGRGDDRRSGRPRRRPCWTMPRQKQDAADEALAEIEKTARRLRGERDDRAWPEQTAKRSTRRARRCWMPHARTRDASKTAAEAPCEREQAAAAQAWAGAFGRARRRDRRAGCSRAWARRPCARRSSTVCAATIRGLPQKDRDAAVADGRCAGGRFSATPLPPDEQAEVREAIAAALGAAPRMTFRRRSRLIAGLETPRPASCPSRNSWRADLERIRAELAHGE